MLSHIPIERKWLVLSVNQETTQKRQRHPTSVVTDAFVPGINNAFTYSQVLLSPLGFHVLRIIKKTCSFRQSVLDSGKWLTETHLVAHHPSLGWRKAMSQGHTKC